MHGFAEAHRVSQNAAEALAVAQASVAHRLNDVVVHEADAADLMRLHLSRNQRHQINILLIRRVLHVDEHTSLKILIF